MKISAIMVRQSRQIEGVFMKQHIHQWQLQEAKNKLSKVVSLAIQQGPQTITLRGKEAVVVISAVDYKKLKRPVTSLVAFLENSPLCEAELDVTRRRDLSRDIDL